MTTWIVSRHPGAVEWLRRNGFIPDQIVPHLDLEALAVGDRIIGTLPIDRVAQVWERGARYYHLCLPLTLASRGRELDADELQRMGASVACFYAKSLPGI